MKQGGILSLFNDSYDNDDEFIYIDKNKNED
jgi:hypothetical protein